MTQHFRYTTLLLLTTLSTVYVSAQSLRKLMEMPPRIIESKWEQTPEGGTELNYTTETCAVTTFSAKMTVHTI